jgi:hypothetical protein
LQLPLPQGGWPFNAHHIKQQTQFRHHAATVAMSQLDFSIDSIRLQIQQIFDRLAGTSAPFTESILIRDGYYCGRRFESEVAYAVWFLEENQIKVHGPDGSVIKVLEPQGTVPGRSRAA